ncbi:YadA-like family protein, partial [Ignatzschineria larvae]
IENKVSAGTLGLVQLAKSKVETEDGESQEVTTLVIDNMAAKEADVFNIANGKEGRTLTGLANGKISEQSLDAINGSQLYSANQNVAKMLGGKATFKEGQLIGVDFSGAFTYTNAQQRSANKITTVYDGLAHLDESIGKLNSDVNTKLGDLDGRVSSLEKGQSGIILAPGATGKGDEVSQNMVSNTPPITEVVEPNAPIESTPPTLGNTQNRGQITINGGIAGKADLNIAQDNGQGDGRKLTGVAEGKIETGSSDAINGNQLYDANTSIANMIGGGAIFDPNTGQFTYRDNQFQVNGSRYDDIASAIEAIDQSQLFKMEGEKIVVNGATGATTVDFTNGKTARNVTGIADGEISATSKDAINGSQLYVVKEDIKNINYTLNHYNTRMNTIEKKVQENRKVASAGIAGAMAMSSIPYIEYSKYSFGMGIGYYDGESAISMGIQGKINNHARYRLQMSYDTQNKVGLGAGVAFEL